MMELLLPTLTLKMVCKVAQTLIIFTSRCSLGPKARARLRHLHPASYPWNTCRKILFLSRKWFTSSQPTIIQFKEFPKADEPAVLNTKTGQWLSEPPFFIQPYVCQQGNASTDICLLFRRTGLVTRISSDSRSPNAGQIHVLNVVK